MKLKLLFIIIIAIQTILVAQNGKDLVNKFDLVLEKNIGNGNENFISNPQEILIDAKKNLLVIERNENCIKIYNTQGKFIKKIGQTGEGPGDFKSIQFVQNDKKGNLYIYDFFNLRIAIYDGSYNFIKTIKTNENFAGFAVLNNGNYMGLVYGPHSMKTQLTKYYLWLFKNDFTKVKLVDSIEIFSSYKDNSGKANISFSGGYELTKLKNGNVLLTTSKDYIFKIFSEDGSVKLDKIIDHTPVKFSQKEKDEMKSFIKKMKSDKLTAIFEEMRYKPAISSIMRNTTDRLYICTFEESGNKSAVDIMDMNGKRVMKAFFPKEPLINKCAIADGYIYSLLMGDKTNPPSVGKYKIIEK